MVVKDHMFVLHTAGVVLLKYFTLKQTRVKQFKLGPGLFLKDWIMRKDGMSVIYVFSSTA